MIRISQLSKRFDVPVLESLSLEVPRGAILGLVGPGAAGKSLLLKLLAGLIPLDYGEVAFGDDWLPQDQSALGTWQRRIGMVFQNNALFDFLSVAENVAFPLRHLTRNEAEIHQRVQERLRQVGLAEFSDRQVARLSGGQKKRVGVARATVTQPPFLLIDEPAAGLDPVSSQKIFDLLRAEQQKRGVTCIVVSSDLDRLRAVSDRIAMLYSGELLFEGSAAEAAATTHPLVRQFLDGNPDGPLR